MPPPPLIPARDRPITLCIETSNPSSSGATAVGLGVGRTPAEATWLGGEALAPTSRHDDALMPAIERLCRAHGVEPSSLARIAVSIGPGGFTSLRIAITTAKLIAEATGAACVGVPTAEALGRAIDPRGMSGARLGVCLAWKREDVWRQVFAPAGDEWCAVELGRIVPLDAVTSNDASMLIADDELTRMLRDRGIDVSKVDVRPPRFDAEHVFRASLGRDPVDPAALVPIYPREPEAVTKWRELRRDPA